MTDEEIGRKAREYMEALRATETEAALLVMCGQFLTSAALRYGGGTVLEVKLGALTYQGQPVGDWIVTAMQLEPPLCKPCAQCGQAFAARRPNNLYCSKICSHRKRQERYKATK